MNVIDLNKLSMMFFRKVDPLFGIVLEADGQVVSTGKLEGKAQGIGSMALEQQRSGLERGGVIVRCRAFAAKKRWIRSAAEPLQPCSWAAIRDSDGSRAVGPIAARVGSPARRSAPA